MACSSSGVAPTTDWPSISTSPLSGSMRPMVVLSSTLFPVPEGPTMERVSPVATLRSTPVRTGTSKALWMSRYSISAMASVQEDRREERVGDQHRDDHEDHRRGGGAAHPFRAAAGQKAHVHGDDRDHEAEDQGLPEGVEEVVAVPEEPCAVEEGLVAQAHRGLGRDHAGQDA